MSNNKKILYFDIETSPMLVWTHYIGHKVSIQYGQVEKPKEIICICYSWGDSKKAEKLVWDYKAKNRDYKLLQEFNEVANQADIMVGHNGIGFDVKEIKTRMALLHTPMPWCETKVVDTLQDYRRNFRFASNRLDAIAKMIGSQGKDKMCFQDWIDVEKGNKKALNKMVKYCQRDVLELKKVHKYLDPYVKETMDTLRYLELRETLPNGCIRCGAKELIKYGRYTYKKADYQRYLCKVCHKVNCPAKY